MVPETLADRTLFITGASRGIGLAIALRAARDGANIIVVAKTVAPHPQLPGTIYTAAAEIEAAGGRALAVEADVRSDEQVERAVNEGLERFGAIDILVNNASAIALHPVDSLKMSRYDLMYDINVRGTFLCSKLCLPLLRRSDNPHVLTMAPPPNLLPRWFRAHSAYTTSKFGMAMTSFGLAAENPDVAFNCLWPKTIIQTAALAMIPGIDPARSRRPAIVADAAYAIFLRSSREFSGRFFLDEDILREAGVTDFSRYAVDLNQKPLPDLYVET